MSKLVSIWVVIVICLPSWASAEFAPSDHRWTVGYEDGVTLRRFLGESWEVFLGVGIYDYGSDRRSDAVQVSPEGVSEFYSEGTRKTEHESNFAILGVGRSILRHNRFWLTGIFKVKFHKEWYKYANDENYASGSINSYYDINHTSTISTFLGLRPAYDLTSRITLVLEFGLNYEHYSSDGEDWDYYSQERLSQSDGSGDRVELVHSTSINSIRFLFRF